MAIDCFESRKNSQLMVEDKILIWKLNRGSTKALSSIYEKYRDDLLRLATALLNDKEDAEDVVQDVFLSFAGSAGNFQLTGSLKGYLATCVANRARNRNRAGQRRKNLESDNREPYVPNTKTLDRWIVNCEELETISNALASVPWRQREVITLHLYGEMKFREIAELQKVSIKTTQSRYRCGLDKLRKLISDQVQL